MRISDWSSDVCSSDLPILIQNILDEVKARNFPLYPFIAQQEGRSLPKLRRFPRELPKSGKHNLHQSTATTGNPAVAQGTPVAARRYFEASKGRSEEHTSELQSLMRISYAVFCLKKKIYKKTLTQQDTHSNQ